jgi:hypothetical protein
MADDSLIDSVAEALAGLTPDALEPILDVLADVEHEVGTLSHDEVVKLVNAAITAAAGAAAGAAVRHYLDGRRPQLEMAVRLALAGQ